MTTAVDVTKLLAEWRSGRPDALSRLLPTVYGELRTLARAKLAGERAGHTLQPTALVHEVYLRLVGGAQPHWTNRRQFFAVAARLMRSLLIDHARARAARKRGGAAPVVSLEDAGSMLQPGDGGPGPFAELIALDQALTKLAVFDARKCRTIQLRFLAGMTIDETAAALEVSTATVILDTRLARAWLHRELVQEAADDA